MSLAKKQVLEADLTWTGNGFHAGIQVAVDADGKIAEIGRLAQPVSRRLAGRALLPGFVNVHSHAFQRALRGRGETFPKGAGSFWTWREAMYQLVESLHADAFYDWSKRAFVEMLASGTTTVGEFHYFRHDGRNEGYAFDEAILRAAQDAGIRLILLPSYYHTGGVNKPLAGGQRRFACASPREYWQQWDRLAAQLRGGNQSMGASVHSIRASGIDDLVEIHEEARRRGLVFHIHVEEQRQEIADCQAFYGKPPMALLVERLKIDKRITAIHCTHTEGKDMDRFAGSGGVVGVCPLTEGNLGDGLCDIPRIHAAGGRVCIGSDSNARICMVEDLRWLEYVQRLRTESRGVCVDDQGNAARQLLESGTSNGALSLGLQTGRIEKGHAADFVTIDLTHPSLGGLTAENLLDGWIFGAGEHVIGETCVGGHWTNKRSDEMFSP